MRYFLLNGTFKADRPQGPEFKAALDAHHEYNAGLMKSGKMMLGGPKPTGSGIMIIKCEDEVEAQQICDNDPFVKLGVQTYDVIEFKKFSCIEALNDWFN